MLDRFRVEGPQILEQSLEGLCEVIFGAWYHHHMEQGFGSLARDIAYEEGPLARCQSDVGRPESQQQAGAVRLIHTEDGMLMSGAVDLWQYRQP